MTPFQSRIYQIVRRIPRGHVLSYGAVAALAGQPRAARAVGAALSALPDGSEVPWWRVISGSGRITTPRVHHIHKLHRALLRGEDVEVGPAGVDMERHAWQPTPAEIAEIDRAMGDPNRIPVTERRSRLGGSLAK